MPDGTNNDDGFIDSVINIIEANLSNPDFTVSDLAGRIPMHRSSFTRKFNELTGKNPFDLLESMRMEKASELLSQSNMPISQITFEVGFTELSNFSRAYKRHFGYAPSNERNHPECTDLNKRQK